MDILYNYNLADYRYYIGIEIVLNYITISNLKLEMFQKT